MSKNNPKSKAVSLFLLLLVVILGSTLTYISITEKNKVAIVTNNGGSTDPKLGAPESEGVTDDSMKDWKTYENDDLGIMFKYPTSLMARENLWPKYVVGLSSLPGDTREMPFPVITLSHIKMPTNFDYKKVLVDDVVYDGSGLSPKSFDEFTLVRLGENDFYYIITGVYEGVFSANYYYVNGSNVFVFQLRSFPVDWQNPNFSPENDELNILTKQILSTFKLVSASVKVPGQTDLIVPRAKSDAKEVSTKATKYSFFYTPSFVKTVKTITDSYYSVDLTLSSGSNLSVSIPFIREPNRFDKKPTLKIIDNPNFKGKIYRIKENDLENTYRYITGYSEDPNVCGFDDDSYFACGDGDAILGEGKNSGAFSISCVASSAVSLKGCDDFMNSLNISVDAIDL